MHVQRKDYNIISGIFLIVCLVKFLCCCQLLYIIETVSKVELSNRLSE